MFRLLGGGTARDSVVTGGPWSLPRVSPARRGDRRRADRGPRRRCGPQRRQGVERAARRRRRRLPRATSASPSSATTASAADRRADDVRDLGWMLWELLTGSRLRAASSTRASRPLGAEPGRADASGPRRSRRGAAAGDVDGGYAVGRRAGARVAGRDRSAPAAARRQVRRAPRRRLGAAGPPRASSRWRRRPASTRTGGCGRSTRPTPAAFHGRDAVVDDLVELRRGAAVRDRRRRVRIGQELGRARRRSSPGCARAAPSSSRWSPATIRSARCRRR